jgi:thioredoxin-dependent peroxiredoxin
LENQAYWQAGKLKANSYWLIAKVYRFILTQKQNSAMSKITLQEGHPAPDFNGIDENGQPVTLADFKGKKLILFFYPKDNTPGCTAEACNLRDNYDALRQRGFEMLGVSPDSPASHLRFKSKHKLPFPLLADTDKTVLKAYGVWGPKALYGKLFDGVNRTTVVIDENGLIARVFDKVKTGDHTRQILEALEG